MSFKPLHPQTIRAPFGNYAHGVLIEPGQRMIRTSGQLGMSIDNLIPETVSKQAALCFANIEAILAEGGMSRANIAHISAYLTKREDMGEYMAARDTFLAGQDEKPASTLLIVSGFTKPEFLVEIEVMAFG